MMSRCRDVAITAVRTRMEPVWLRLGRGLEPLNLRRPCHGPLLRSLNIPEAARGSSTIVLGSLEEGREQTKSAAKSFVWAALQFSLDDCY
jgi:hypothetical protein